MLKRILHDKKGAAMEWAIVFGLVIFAIIGLILSMMTTFRINTKLAQKSDQRHNDLNQIGEYFVRAVGTKSEFLNGGNFTKAKLQNLNQSDYPWLDNEAISFFDQCNTDYGYTYNSQYGQENQGTFWNFYRDEGRSRKLTVKSGNNKVLSIVIAENITYDESRSLILTSSYNPETSFDILEWTIYDEIDDLGGDKTNFLQRIWQWIGGAFGRVEVSTQTSCTIRYNHNYSDKSTLAVHLKGSQITLPTPTREGYSFLNWSDSTGKTYAGNSHYTVSDNITFTANWQEYTGPTYSIVFHKNDGTNTSDTESNIRSDSYNISGNRNFERDGYNFKGWSASTSGNAISSPYKFSGDSSVAVNLYALWEPATYNITYNKTNVGSYTYKPNDSQTVALTYTPSIGKTYSISTTTKGSINSDDSKKIDIPAGTFGDITVTITESLAEHTISLSPTSTNGGEYELIDHTNGKAHYGETVSFTASATISVTSVTVKAKNGDQTYAVTHSGGRYSFTMPDCDVTIRVEGTSPTCVASETLVTMANGSQMLIENIMPGDELLTYNLDTGLFEKSSVSKIYYHGDADYDVLSLTFSNRKTVEIINVHGFLNCTKHTYSQISTDNFESFIGDEFMLENGETVKLISGTVIKRHTGSYSIITAYNENFITNGIVSITGNRSEVFEIGSDMRYIKEQKESDIGNYGLFAYEEFCDYISEKDFYELNCQYYKILLEKGYIDYDYIYEQIPILTVVDVKTTFN